MTRVLVTFFLGLVLLIRPLVISVVIFVTVLIIAALPFTSVQAVDRLQTPAISHYMARVRMSRARPLKDLGVGILIIALGCWLDGIDGVIHNLVVALPPPKVVLLTPITIVIATVMIIVAPIVATVVTTQIIASVVRAMIWLVGARSSANILLDLLVGLVSICPLLHHHEKVLNRVRPLAEKFGPKGIMVAEASDKHRDGFIAVDIRDGYLCFQEAADVVAQRFIWIVSDFLQIILVARLLTSGHIILNKSPPELCPGVDGAFPQAEKPLVHGLVDDHQQIVGHHIFIAMCCSDNNFIERYPLFGISLPIICVEIVELEVSWPDDSTDPISE
jgi:hypothetical protein